MIADEIERMAEIFARKGSARSGGSNGDGCEVGGRDDDPETPPYALAAMSRELRTLIAVLPGLYG